MELDNAGISGVAEDNRSSSRAEIDTSAPFESVKEAVTRFGGVGYWKPTLTAFSVPQHLPQEVDVGTLEEQKDVLQNELVLKERETLDVLKELESTKRLVEDLRSKLQKEEAEAITITTNATANFTVEMNVWDECDKNAIMEEREDKENQLSSSLPSSAPGLILMELKQAKLNLTRTTTDIADVRASVELLNKKLEKERISLEKTRERLTQNSSKISSLEQELNQTRLKLQVAKNTDEIDPSDIAKELQRLSSEAENFRKMGEAAKSQAVRTMSEIEQTKTMIRTAEIRIIAARKMKEAARAAEAMAIAEINALSNYQSSKDGVTLSFQDFTAFTQKAREAEEHSKKRMVDAMLRVDEANSSKMDILKRVEEATEEVKSSKKALEEALERVEAANRGKLAVEEALRKWRSENQRRRSSIQNSTKFKNPCPSHLRRDSKLLDVNGLNLVNNDDDDDDEVKPVLKPTLSIGQILSRKLLLPEEYEGRNSVKRKVSLGQMLGKQNDDGDEDFGAWGKADKETIEIGQKQFSSSAKRKKFGFARFSLLLAKQQKKKKKQTMSMR